MRHTNMTPRSATIAIAAVLALGTTSIGSAQDAAPVEAAPAPAEAAPVDTAPVLPSPIVSAPAAEPAPTTFQSPFAPAPTFPATTNPVNTAPTTTTGERQFTSSPTVQTIEKPESALIDPVAAPATNAAASADNATTAPATSTVVPASDAASDLDLVAADPLLGNASSESAIDAAAPIALPAADSDVAPTNLTENSQIMALGAAAIALLAGLIVMMLFWRRRKPLPIHKKAQAEERIRKVDPIEEKAPETITVPAPQVKADSFTKLTSVVNTGSAVRAAKPASSDTLISAQSTKHYRPLPHAGAAIALPAKAPETVEGRTQLLNDMAAAKPDRANPFVAHKARKRRARMILQSLGRTFENGSKIDFSQYPQNFPELAAKQTIAA